MANFTISYDDKNKNYLKTVGKNTYTVTPDDARYREIEKQYNKQEMDKVGIPELYAPGSVASTADSIAPYTAPASKSAGNMSGGGAASNKPSGFDYYESAMNKSLGAQNDAIDAQVAAAMKNYQAGIDRQNQIYDQGANNAYINYMMAQKAMPQQVAALGLSGTGTAESINLGNAVNYQNNLNSNEQQRANALTDFYNQMAATNADAGLQKAAMQQSVNESLANMYLNRLDVDTQQQLAREQMAADKENADRNYNLQVRQMDAADKQYADQQLMNIYASLISLGMSTPDIAKYLGVDEKKLQNAMDKVLAS